MARPRKIDVAQSTPVVAKRGPGRPKTTKNQPLTRKQELFVKELVSKDGQITMREAAINAGYPVSSAHTRAYELTHPHIRQPSKPSIDGGKRRATFTSTNLKFATAASTA